MTYAKIILEMAHIRSIVSCNCFLDGVDGKKEALVVFNGNTSLSYIAALDASISIVVRRKIVDLKLEQDDKPTFYYS